QRRIARHAVVAAENLGEVVVAQALRLPVGAGVGGAHVQAHDAGLAAPAATGADPGPAVTLDDPDHFAPPVVVAPPGVPQRPVRPEPAPAFRPGYQVTRTRRALLAAAAFGDVLPGPPDAAEDAGQQAFHRPGSPVRHRLGRGHIHMPQPHRGHRTRRQRQVAATEPRDALPGLRDHPGTGSVAGSAGASAGGSSGNGSNSISVISSPISLIITVANPSRSLAKATLPPPPPSAKKVIEPGVP